MYLQKQRKNWNLRTFMAQYHVLFFQFSLWDLFLKPNHLYIKFINPLSMLMNNKKRNH